MPLDPIVEQMLAQMAEAGGPALEEMTPAEGRQMYREMQTALPKPEMAQVEDRDVNGVPVRIYRVNQDTGPCIVYYHGGGWVIGDLETHDGVCRQLAEAAGMTVIAVDYRLAPEHPFPAAIDDCYAVTCHVAQNAAEFNIDPARISVAGDSAGGNLAAAVCIRAKRESGPAIVYQLLIYPATDASMNTPSCDENAEGYLLTKASMEWFWNHYIGGSKEAMRNPYAAPAAADDLSGLPPAFVITAEFDPLRDEGEAYGERLKAAGVPTLVKRYDSMIHGFFGMTDMLAPAKDAMQTAAEQIRKAAS